MKLIRAECKPLFRFLPVSVGHLSTYRPRESKGKGKGKGKEPPPHASGDEEEEGELQTEWKWIMVRYPWQERVPEEDEPPCSFFVGSLWFTCGSLSVHSWFI